MPSLKSTRKATTPTQQPITKPEGKEYPDPTTFTDGPAPLPASRSLTSKSSRITPVVAASTLVPPATKISELSPSDLLIWNSGLASSLADLAEAKGMTVEGVSDCPHFLAEAGLPEKISPTLGHAAHRIYRDRIDAVMWRCNRPLNQAAPVLTRPQAEAHVAKVEQEKTIAREVAKVKAVEASQPKKDRPVAAPVVAEVDPIEF